MTDDGFGALMCQKCAQSQIRLGEWGGGDTIGGGGWGRRPGSHIYIYILYENMEFKGTRTQTLNPGSL